MLDSGVYTPRLGELITAQDDPLRLLNIGNEVLTTEVCCWQAELVVIGTLIDPEEKFEGDLCSEESSCFSSTGGTAGGC